MVQRLSDEINRIQAQPDMIAKVRSMNIRLPSAKSPEQFRLLVADDLRGWKRVVNENGIAVSG